MVNQSFEEAVFPEAGKLAIVKPIIKKSNLDPFDLKSWQPISNIGFVAKITECIAIQRFNSHVTTHGLLPTSVSLQATLFNRDSHRLYV